MSRPLESTDVAALLGRLTDAQGSLAAVERAERIATLGGVAERWLGDLDDLARTADEIARSTGYAPAMIRACLERTLRAWSTEPLATLVERTLAQPGSVGTAPSLVVVVLAQNTPGLAIAPTFSALALGSAVLLKCARGEESFAPRLVARIADADARLGAACEARVWPGGDPLERELFARASCVVVYGPAKAVDNARASAPGRVVACGPRTSIAVVGDVSDEAVLARRLARDVAFLDQRGCLSPQAVFVHEAVDRSKLGRAVARELAALEEEWPRRGLDTAEAAAFRRAAEAAEAKSLGGSGVELLGGVGAAWAVVVETETKLEASPLDRFLRLHPFRDADALAEALAPLRGHLECVGLSGDDVLRADLEQVCRRAGAGRTCEIGSMQDPPADWHASGRLPLVDYLSWSGREDESPDAGTTGRRERFLRYVAQTSDAPRGLDVARARGSWVYTTDGRRHLDLLAGIGVAHIGHAHPRVAAAVAEQSARYTHVMVYGEDVLTPQVDLAERLARLLPSPLSVTYFTNSGAEAIEGALKLVRKATGRTRVAAFEGAYHGDTTGAMALGGNPYYREPFEPLVGPVVHLPWNDESALARIDDTTAAVFAEPVQAEGGVRVPSPGFLPALARRCREVGALLVFDEVVTALGRTGRWFGLEHWPDATPDVVVLAKSLGGGLPLGAFVTSPDLSRALSHDPPLGHVTTFGGNPVCCAAGLAALDVLADERLPERAARVGADFAGRLAGLGGGALREVRSLGLLIGLELVSPERTVRFVDACRDEGVLLGWTLHHDRVVRLAPPLSITGDEIEHALAVLSRALAD